MPATAYPHLVYDDQGRLRIEGVGYKALILLETYLAQDWSVDQLLEQFPALTRGQAYSLLAYYYDNKHELDDLIARRDEEFEALRATTEDPELQARLANLKLPNAGE